MIKEKNSKREKLKFNILFDEIEKHKNVNIYTQIL